MKILLVKSSKILNAFSVVVSPIQLID